MVVPRCHPHPHGTEKLQAGGPAPALLLWPWGLAKPRVRKGEDRVLGTEGAPRLGAPGGTGQLQSPAGESGRGRAVGTFLRESLKVCGAL